MDVHAKIASVSFLNLFLQIITRFNSNFRKKIIIHVLGSLEKKKKKKKKNYASREKKNCLPFGSGGNLHKLWTANSPRGVYTIFNHTWAKDTTFAFMIQEQKWYFR